MIKKLSFVLVLALVVGLIAGCTPAQKSGGTLIVGESSLKGVFNPIFYNDVYDGYVVDLIFDGLVKNDASGQVIPNIAKEWVVSEDKLTYTFTLKDGVKFSDGTPVTAEDVEFTYECVANANYDGSRGYWVSDFVGVDEFKAGTATKISGIEVVDAKTIKFTVKTPNVAKIWDFAVGILSKEYYAFSEYSELKAKNTTPMGAGPFKFKEYLPDQYCELERNDGYHAGKAKLDGVIIKIVPEETKIAAVDAGDIHLAQVTANKDNYDAIVAAANADVQRYVGNGYNYIGLNLVNPKLSDKRVRQALAYGLNRAQFIENEYKGLAVVCQGPVSPVSWAYPGNDELNLYEFNPDKAKELLDDAGWVVGSDGYRYKDGTKLTLTWTAYTEVAWPQNLIALATDNWKQIGVELKSELLDFNSVATKVFDEQNFEMWNMGWSLSIDPDPTGIFGEDQKVKGGFNAGQFTNARAYEIFELQKKEYDQDARKALLKEWAVIANEELPYIFMAIREEIWAVNKKVGDLELGPYYNWVANIMDISLSQ
jgi:peptide/nickel transport system substrate-binding protein